MSGGYGAARNGKIKVKALVKFADTGRIAVVHRFVSVYQDLDSMIDAIENKYEADLKVIKISTIGGLVLLGARPDWQKALPDWVPAERKEVA